MTITNSASGQYLAVTPITGSIHTSSDYGYTWTIQRNSGYRIWRGISSSYSGQYLAACEYGSNGGYIYTSSNYGVDWTQQTGCGGRIWSDIICSSNGQHIYACEQLGLIYRSSDFGVTWEAIGTSPRSGIACSRYSPSILSSSSSSSSVTSYEAIDGKYLASFDREGHVWTSDNYGETWIEQSGSPIPSGFWVSISMSYNGQYIGICDDDGYIWTSNDYGVTWIKRDNRD